MGDIAQGQTKRIKVTDGQGVELTPAQFSAAVSDETIATAFETGDQTAWDLTGVSEGSVTITATGGGDHAGQSGTLDITVDPAPLVIELVDA